MIDFLLEKNTHLAQKILIKGYYELEDNFERQLVLPDREKAPKVNFHKLFSNGILHIARRIFNSSEMSTIYLRIYDMKEFLITEIENFPNKIEIAFTRAVKPTYAELTEITYILETSSFIFSLPIKHDSDVFTRIQEALYPVIIMLETKLWNQTHYQQRSIDEQTRISSHSDELNRENIESFLHDFDQVIRQVR